MNHAFGKPGGTPTWTTGAKSGIGTSAGPGSLVWFTTSQGIINEVYYPNIDTPNMKEMGFLVAGERFFSEEKANTQHEIERLDQWAPAYRITNTCQSGRYRILKEITTDPSRNVLLQRVCFEPLIGDVQDYTLFSSLTPHIHNNGLLNNGWTGEYEGKPVLFASRKDIVLAVASSVPFVKRSAGYIGRSDGWTDISEHYQMTHQFESAEEGSIALTGQIDLPPDGMFTLAIAFGRSAEEAARQACESIHDGFDQSLKDYVRGWTERVKPFNDLSAFSGDNGALFRSSVQVLLTHQDKLIQGATIASLAIPWGEAQPADGSVGGYHLVWPRDLVQTATAHLAIGDVESARQTLLYLTRIQEDNGGWHQNNWIDGSPFWDSVQLDETAFPIILAWRLSAIDALGDFDPWPMVRKATAFLVRTGPVTQQERWEENGGYSPSTLAACITALLCAADMAIVREQLEWSAYTAFVADWWAGNLDSWTYTTNSLLDPDLPAHYERLNTIVVSDPDISNPDQGRIPIRNLSPDLPSEFPANDVVDAGFLQLVYYGVRSPEDPHIRQSIQVIDKVLKVDLPAGPSWYRYNHDGYGEHENGDPFSGWGVGQAWPLLTGERAHYELAAGNIEEAVQLAHAMEKFSTGHHLLPEQVWTMPDIPERSLQRGRPSGSAMPLVWAHAEYIKLLRSLSDQAVFDQIPIVSSRYKDGPPPIRNVWRFNHKVRTINVGEALRIEVLAGAVLHWSPDNWHTILDNELTESEFGTWYFDLPESVLAKPATIQLTFYWVESGNWEGTDYTVIIRDPLTNS